MKSTLKGGNLQPIENCYIESDLQAAGALYSMGETSKLIFDNIPDISDAKSANYTDESAIGRTAPFKNYAYSENRSINVDLHMFVQEESGNQSAQAILDTLRWLEAHVYPEKGTGGFYSPPPIMKLKCFDLLEKNDLCVVLKSYNVKFDPGVPWDEDTGIPYKLDVSLTFEAVYKSDKLPYASDVVMGETE